MKPTRPLPYQSEWTFDLLEAYNHALGNMAHEFQLDCYPHRIEIIDYEQMIDAYAASGLPMTYPHWSYGKHCLDFDKRYRLGHMELAYEIVINSNPCTAYLMSQSTLTMQAIVMAHACYGHNAFFKNNYTFKLWSDPESILEYLLWAKSFISDCEKKHGIEAVESLLDACHALKAQGIDYYKRPQPLSLAEESKRQQQRLAFIEAHVNNLWQTVVTPKVTTDDLRSNRYPTEPHENLLSFIEENSPHLPLWQREIIHIVRTLAQYFYPQQLTKMMNEGWACFWHYTLIQALYDEGWLQDEFMLQFIQYHSHLLHQPSYDDPHYSGLNPYTLGYKIFNDIKRICQNPTDEDKQYFPKLCHSDWLAALQFAMRNFKDESFIIQYLSPQLIRELKLFVVLDDPNQQDLEISAIHNAEGYATIRHTLAQLYQMNHREPNIQVYHADIQGDHTLTLRHYAQQERPLALDTPEVLAQIYRLWGYPIYLESVTEAGSVLTQYTYPIVETNTANRGK